MRRLHLLIIPSWYPSNDEPTCGVFFLDQARALQRAGHRVNVLVAPQPKSFRRLRELGSFSNLRSRTEIEVYQGLTTYRVSQWAWIPLRFNRGSSYHVLCSGHRLFKRYAREQGLPDLIHAHSAINGGYLATAIGERWNVPVVLTEHISSILSDSLSPAQKDIVSYTLQRTRKNIAVGPALSRKLLDYRPKSNPTVVGNCIDTRFFDLSRPLPSTTPFIFGNLSILYKTKGVDILVRAFARAFKNENVFLRIAGDGEQRKSLERLSKELGMDKQISFLGMIDRNQVRDFIHGCHAIVSSSRVETFGVNLIEAMACGKPVVATRAGGPEMFVNDINGILVPPEDIESLSAGMRDMLSMYKSFKADVIRQYCVDHFSEEAIVRRLEEVFEGAM